MSKVSDVLHHGHYLASVVSITMVKPRAFYKMVSTDELILLAQAGHVT